MFIEAIQMVTDFLSDPVQGVNAQLQLIPSGSAVTPIALIVDASRNRQVAQGFPVDVQTSQVSGSIYPQLAIGFYADTTLDPMVFTGVKRDGVIPIRIRYVNQSTDTDLDAVMMYIVMRAIQRSLKLFMLQTNVSNRQRDGIGVFGIQTISVSQMFTDQGSDSLLDCSMLVEFNCRDNNP